MKIQQFKEEKYVMETKTTSKNGQKTSWFLSKLNVQASHIQRSKILSHIFMKHSSLMVSLFYHGHQPHPVTAKNSGGKEF